MREIKEKVKEVDASDTRKRGNAMNRNRVNKKENKDERKDKRNTVS